jgi:hypothetical protein
MWKDSKGQLFQIISVIYEYKTQIIYFLKG